MQHKECEDVTGKRAEVQSRLRADEEARKSGDNRKGVLTFTRRLVGGVA